MQSHKLLLICVVIFGLLLGGALTLQTRAQELEVKARINPQFISLEDPYPVYFMITLSDFPDPYTGEDVVIDSILVGGQVEMTKIVDESDEWPKISTRTFRFMVFADDLLDWVILPPIMHLEPDPHTRVDADVLVEGQFGDGIAFEGTCTVTIFTEREELDNPIPAPG